MPRRSTPLLPSALAVGLLLAVMALAPNAHAATTEATAQSSLLRMINTARAERGLRPLRSEARLGSLAVKRARYMVSSRQLSHDTYGGDVETAVSSTGIRWMRVGEAVAMASHAAPASVASVIFELWRNSPPHWDLITSKRFNYVGAGVALTSGGGPYAALVLVEMADDTAPVASMTVGSASGRTVTWSWTGRDVLLQTHTSGVCTYDVQYRLGAGPWRVLRSATTARSLSLASRTSGDVHSLRVRARDCAGNVGAWSPAKAVRVL